MKNFDYAAPTSLAEATALLARADGTARILAGGTDLLVQLREHLRDADLVVDVKKIPELMRAELRARDRACGSGASVPCYRIYEDAGDLGRLSGAGRRGADRGRLADPEPGQRGRKPLQLVAGGRHDSRL